MFLDFVIIGLPASGKTTIAELLVKDFKEKGKNLQVISTDKFLCKLPFEKDIALQKFIKEKELKVDIKSYNNSEKKDRILYGKIWRKYI